MKVKAIGSECKRWRQCRSDSACAHICGRRARVALRRIPLDNMADKDKCQKKESKPIAGAFVVCEECLPVPWWKKTWHARTIFDKIFPI